MGQGLDLTSLDRRAARIEHKLVVQRANVGVDRFVDQLVLTWEFAAEREENPNIDNLLEDLVAQGYYTPLTPSATNYIAYCLRRNTIPDRPTLRQLLLSRHPSRRNGRHLT